MGLETRTHVLAVVACGAVDHFLDDDPLQWKRVVGWLEWVIQKYEGSAVSVTRQLFIIFALAGTVNAFPSS